MEELDGNVTLSGIDLEESDLMPGYLDFFNKTWVAFQEFGLNFKKYPHDNHFNWRMVCSVRAIDVFIVLCLAVAMTICRACLTKYIIRPWTTRVRLTASNASKMPESCWKLIMYTGLWLYSLNCVVLSGRHAFFFKPCRVWFVNVTFDVNKYFDMEIPSDIYWMYVFQLGFYVHSVYATLYMDTWRKDSMVMLLHHVITILLLEFSFLMKYYKVGALVLFLHDISDVLLEFTKINVYLKYRGGRKFWINDFLSSLGFFTFTISWAWFRLYWYPLKVLHACSWCVYVHQLGRDPKMYLILNTMLWMLGGLHLYWFYFIMLLLIKIATGQMKEVEDTREFEVEDALRRMREESESHGQTVVNGKPAPSVDDRLKAE